MSIYIISDGVPEPDPEQFTVSLSTDNVLVSIEEETAVVVIFEGKFMKLNTSCQLFCDFLCVNAQIRNAYNGHPRNAWLLCIHKHHKTTFLMGMKGFLSVWPVCNAMRRHA